MTLYRWQKFKRNFSNKVCKTHATSLNNINYILESCPQNWATLTCITKNVLIEQSYVRSVWTVHHSWNDDKDQTGLGLSFPTWHSIIPGMNAPHTISFVMNRPDSLRHHYRLNSVILPNKISYPGFPRTLTSARLIFYFV